MDKHTVLGSRVLRIVQALRHGGLDVDSMCPQIGIDVAALAMANARCPIEAVRALWELAAQTSGNADIGLEVAGEFSPVGLDVLDYAMMSSVNLRAALERAIRYSRIVDDATEYRCSELASGWKLGIVFQQGGRAVPRQSVDFILHSSLNFCRWIAGASLRPLRVEFRHPAPANLRSYEAAFQCPLEFGAAQDSMLFSHADLDRRLQTHNPQLAVLHERCADEQIAELQRGKTSNRVRELVMLSLPSGEPTRRQIASALCLSERTLLRRLQDEGTTFHRLLDETRRSLAEYYLTSGSVSLTEATYLLGFSDQSNFCRATRRWFECAPRQVQRSTK